jgi:hypothetical protein
MAVSKPKDAPRRATTVAKGEHRGGQITVSRTSSGHRTWTITAVAEDASADALKATAQLALEIDRELAEARVPNRNGNV